MGVLPMGALAERAFTWVPFQIMEPGLAAPKRAVWGPLFLPVTDRKRPLFCNFSHPNVKKTLRSFFQFGIKMPLPGLSLRWGTAQTLAERAFTRVSFRIPEPVVAALQRAVFGPLFLALTYRKSPLFYNFSHPNVKQTLRSFFQVGIIPSVGTV